MARQISDDEELTRDWDWYAVDEFGVIGHFTTAGFRKLPGVIKGDFEAAERCIHYFFEETPVRGAYSVSDDLENEAGPFKGDTERQRYLQSFAQMAERGLFLSIRIRLGAVQGGIIWWPHPRTLCMSMSCLRK